jgi:hypothetical protein
VALQGIGAPFLIGLVASLLYFFDIRRQVASAHATRRQPVDSAA